MKKYTIFVVLSAVLLISTKFALGQSIESGTERVAGPPTLMSMVYVQDLKADVGTNNVISGSFVARNSENATVSGLTYEVQFLGAGPKVKPGELVTDNAVPFDKQPSKDIFSLGPNESKTISYSYTAPTVPTGDYRIRVQLLTSNGRPSGWETADVKIVNGGVYPIIGTVSLNVEAEDPVLRKSKKEWRAGEGPNVDPGTEFTISLRAKNDSPTSVSGKLIMKTKKALTITNSTEKSIEIKDMTIKGKGDETFEVPVKAEATPGVYTGTIALYDPSGNRISVAAEFRYVVKGESASVISLKIKDFSKGLADIEFSVAGSADRLSTVKGSLEAHLLNNRTECGKVVKDIELKLAPISGTAAVPYGKCTQEKPQLGLKILSSKGEVLDYYIVDVPNLPAHAVEAVTQSNPGSTNRTSGSVSRSNVWQLVLAVVVAVIGIVAAGIVIFRRKRKVPFNVITLFIAAVTLYGLFGNGFGAKAGIHYVIKTHFINDPDSFSVLINKPQHGGTYAYGNVPYEAHVYWYQCGNSWSDWNHKIYAKNGGEFGSSIALPPASDWSSLISRQGAYHCWRCNEWWWWNDSYVSGVLSLPGPYAGGKSTILSTSYYITYMPPDSWYREIQYEDFTYVNFPVNPTCTVSSNTASVNNPVTYTSSVATAQWSNGGSPATGSGATFTTSFGTPGSKTVTLTNNLSTLSGNIVQTVQCPGVTVQTLPAVACELPNGSSSVSGVTAGQTVVLKGKNAPAGTTYSWNSLAPIPNPAATALVPNDANSERVTFTAPTFYSPAENTYRYKVQSPGTTGEANCSITVAAATREPVSCNVSSSSVYPGQSVALTTTGGDLTANFTWTALDGGPALTYSDPVKKQTAAFVAPNDARLYNYKVSDGFSEDTCTIRVNVKSIAPSLREL